MSGYEKNTQRDFKTLQNAEIGEFLRKNAPTIRSALIIDTSDGLTTKMLLDFGLSPDQIWVVNYELGEMVALQRKIPGVAVFVGSFLRLVSIPATKQFDLVYYDSCSTIRTAYRDFTRST